jgi:hypothetical protein
MAKFSQSPINNVLAAERARAPVSIIHDGEQRLDRRPYGKIERFVDPVGNVITVQMAQAGDPSPKAAAERKRLLLHAEGWVEHTKCPFRHGHHNSVTGLQREFNKMPRSLVGECNGDPAPMAVVDGEKHAQKACQHIEWLIVDRRAREAVQSKKRNAAMYAEEKRKADAAALAEAQLEMVKEQIEERKARKAKPKAPE